MRKKHRLIKQESSRRQILDIKLSTNYSENKHNAHISRGHHSRVNHLSKPLLSRNIEQLLPIREIGHLSRQEYYPLRE